MSTLNTPGFGQAPIYTQSKVNFGWIGEAWDLYRKAWLPWFLLFLLPIITYVVYMIYSFTTPQMLAMFSMMRPGHAMNPGSMPTQSISSVIVSYLFSFAQYGIFFVVACCGSDMALRQARGEVIGIEDIFRGMRNWVQVLVFCILWVIVSSAGVFACCVGVYVAYGFLLPGFALVADGESAANSLTRSIEGMKVDWLTAALFSFVFYLVMGFGTLFTCFLGSFALYPMMFIVSALSYRDMIGMPGPGGVGWLGPPPKPLPWQQYHQPALNQQPQGVWPPAPTAAPPPYGQQSGQFGQPPYAQQSGPYRQTPLDQQPPTDSNELPSTAPSEDDRPG